MGEVITDTRSEIEKNYHLASARHNLYRSNLELYERLSKDPEAAKVANIDLEALKEVTAPQASETVWDNCYVAGAAVLGAAWLLQYDGASKVTGWDGGLIMGASGTWGTMVWAGKPPSPGTSLTNSFTSVAVGGGYTHIELWNEQGVKVGWFNGGGIGLIVYTGGGKAQMQ